MTPGINSCRRSGSERDLEAEDRKECASEGKPEAGSHGSKSVSWIIGSLFPRTEDGRSCAIAFASSGPKTLLSKSMTPAQMVSGIPSLGSILRKMGG